MLALLLRRQLDLPHRRINPLRKRRQRRTDAGLEQCVRALEQPRIAQRAAPIITHPRRYAARMRTASSVRPHHRWRYRNAHRLPTARIASQSAVPLYCCERVRPCSVTAAAPTAQPCWQTPRSDALLVPSLAKLDRYRHIDRVDDRFNHRMPVPDPSSARSRHRCSRSSAPDSPC